MAADDLFSLLGFIIGGMTCDWLAATRGGAYFSDFDYRYWPLTRFRQLGLVTVLLAAVDMWASAPPNGALWNEIVFGVLIVAWAATILVDVYAQRRVGYKKPRPPRYSDSEYGS